MEFFRSNEFKRQYKKLDRDIREKFEARLRLLVATKDNPDPLLNDHSLNPPYRDFRSINITGDWRLIYRRLGPETWYLLAIGTHHQLFGK
jgi:addiction module RelE/StbE family toxin